jgi:hypothetical protein
MPNLVKQQVIDVLRSRYGELRKLPGTNSLFEIGEGAARIYTRYSKVHSDGRTFFGLREVDLQQLAGRNAFICFITNDASEPIFVPFADFEEVFRRSAVASDGQYKVQIVSQHQTKELAIPHAGRFNLDGFLGYEGVGRSLTAIGTRKSLDLSHSQVQTLLGAIGKLKGFDVYVPTCDACRLDWGLVPEFPLRGAVPAGFESVANVMSEIDVIWVSAGRHTIEGLFEVEHSTPIYSGLLRFNDVLLTSPQVDRYFVVSNEARRDLFARQLFRPTFRHSGLAERTSFLEYANVFDWHKRLASHGAMQ